MKKNIKLISNNDIFVLNDIEFKKYPRLVVNNEGFIGVFIESPGILTDLKEWTDLNNNSINKPGLVLKTDIKNTPENIIHSIELIKDLVAGDLDFFIRTSLNYIMHTKL